MRIKTQRKKFNKLIKRRVENGNYNDIDFNENMTDEERNTPRVDTIYIIKQ